jgi:rhodanese-related sulfurtransferase/DNA-binding transcriptional ArsR family regulator
MSSKCSPAQVVRACFAEVAKAVAHEHRLGLLERLAQGERSVEALAESTGLSVANASQHLQQLKRVGLLLNRRDGKRIIYRLANEREVVAFMSSLRHLADRAHAGLERIRGSYFDVRDELEPVTRKQLISQLRTGRVTLLDVRPSEEFARGHIRQAVNIPLAELERRLKELPRNHQIVAYCRGPYCVLSFEAVATLRARGWKIRRLEDGYPEWKAAGLPIGQVTASVEAGW